MTRFRYLSILTFMVFACGLSTTSFAQDREKIVQEIESLKAQIKEKEKEFLAPSKEDKTAFASFLSQPDTGLIRLMPREKYQNKLLIREGGAYYSFSRLVHEYGYGSDIGLEQSFFSVGFAGANFAFLTDIGDVPIEAVTPEHPATQFLLSFVVPTLEPGAREQQRITGTGFQTNNFSYKNRLAAKVNATYVLRSIDYGTSDVLVAVRVVRQDVDGSMILAWKMLKQFPTPKLERP